MPESTTVPLPSARPGDTGARLVVPAPRKVESVARVPVGAPDETMVLPRFTDSAPDQTVVIPRVAEPVAEAARAPGWLPSLGRAPEVLALSAFGVVLVALAYQGGRSGAGWAGAAYWLGQLVVSVPVAVRMFFRRLAGVAESFVLVMGLAVDEYLQKWLYSPDQFRFPDELQHWVGTNILLQDGRLFQPNNALPVAVHFPGLEEMTASLSSMTGLSITNAGLLVAGVAHLAFIGLLFLVVRSTGGSAELAGAVCVIYSTALHYLFFDSMFIYQTAALPFLMLVIWASRRWEPRQRHTAVYAVLCGVGLLGVSICHHVTAAATIATLGLIGACEAVMNRPRRWATLIVAGAGVVLVTGWFALVAREVFGYLGPPVEQMVGGVAGMLRGGGSSGGSSSPGNPMWQLAVEAFGLLALLGLLVRAGLVSWRSSGRFDAWRAAALIGALVFFASTAVRFVGSEGPELAGRASTFTYIPMSMVAAGVLVGWRPRLRGPSRPLVVKRAVDGVLSRMRPIWVHPVVLGPVIVTLLMAGSRVGGWPPYWEQLPGPYLVSGYERSVDQQGVAGAVWTYDWLGPDHRVAADITGATLVSTYGEQNPVGEASKLYYDGTWNLDDELLLQSLGVDYLWVDTRISQQLPISGAYFPVDPQTGQHTAPIPQGNLSKFDDVAGINRVYDSGDIHVYDMRNA
ncbi:hypothetical protein [Rugosimonospora africana]|uniref:Uncharacterized protein n=1 Tax=Rugosimonospora africana TaxID=556532 RepID=A0A8J3QNT3_9ACTN|nr:hypothetical protein [Rugosimonospora africana]GIH13861.1 hypothetical protein Raf01_20330 [Rugosimonospora africana]